MKKPFIFLFFLILFTASHCDKEHSEYLFEKQYSSSQEAESLDDVYAALYRYDIDSLPLKNWMINKLKVDSNSIIQHFIRVNVADTMQLVFIYSIFDDDSTYYQLKIRKERK